MSKKLILSTAAALTLLIGMQAPASATPGIAKPAVAPAGAASDFIEVRGRSRGFRRHGDFRRLRGSRRRIAPVVFVRPVGVGRF